MLFEAEVKIVVLLTGEVDVPASVLQNTAGAGVAVVLLL